MSSEYDPLFAREGGEDLAQAQELFGRASAAYLSFPWSWVAWALLLPGAALATPAALEESGGAGVLALWSGAILVGGIVEGTGIWRGRGRHGATSLGGWVLRSQGNLSLVALLLSVALVVVGQSQLLPGLWLLLLGHNFYGLGGLAFPPLRVYGIWYQVFGALALFPWFAEPLRLFAAATFVGNLWVAWAVGRASRTPSAS